MIKRLFLYTLIGVAGFLASCNDNDSFTTSPANILTFSQDTVSMDTVFSTIPTSTRTLMVYNNSGDGVRLSKVRLGKGNQTGFRVNVDGFYLDNTLGSQVSDIEVRDGDSIRVFVELTSKMNGQDIPTLVEDDIIFSLESGVDQKVNMRAWSWDATITDSIVVATDTVITSHRPIVIKRGVRIDSLATMTILSPAKLYFDSNAGIDVYGSLKVEGNIGDDVVMRGSRTDNMFDYLPYDRVSGQWRGIHIHASSTENTIIHADIHSTDNAIVIDSAAFDKDKVRLKLDCVTLHNCKGSGLIANNANIVLSNCQISNTLGDCLAIYGGKALVVYCTLAQFYPLDANRGAALRFANYKGDYSYHLHLFECYNSLVTGYADDVVMGEVRDTTVAYQYYFENCLLRTTEPDNANVENSPIVNTIFEKTDVEGRLHFKEVDIDNLSYDFHLVESSAAIGKAIPLIGFDYDRNGNTRTTTPDIGCFQTISGDK